MTSDMYYWPLINFGVLLLMAIAGIGGIMLLLQQLDIIHRTVNSNLSEAQDKLNIALEKIQRLEARIIRGEWDRAGERGTGDDEL